MHPHREPHDPFVEGEIRRFDPSAPLEAAWLPPASWYRDERFHDLERRTVFRRHWLVAARADQLRNAGDYVAGSIAGEPVVVVRAEDGALHAFYNVCRHHAAQVMAGAGCADALVCPYHGWTYALDGRLLRAPELGPVRDFDRGQFGLVPMHVAEWCGLVFVCRAESPPPLAPRLAELESRLRAMRLDDLRFVERRKYVLACNWKVYVDNYLDGGYHVSYLHRGLAAQLDLDSYRTEIFDHYSIQSGAGAGAVTADSATDFAARIGDRVLYAWIHPNLMINRYGPMMDVNIVLPRGPEETEVVFDYYFLPGAAADEGFVRRSIDSSHVVQVEDVEICESVQRGLASSSYDRGRYSARREGAELHFHRLLAADYDAA